MVIYLIQAKAEDTASPKAAKKEEKKVEEAPKKVEESTKAENGSAPKKGRGRPSKGDKPAAPKRPASGKG